MQGDYYENFVDSVNALAGLARIAPGSRREKDISLGDLGDVLSQIQRELENIETRKNEELRDAQWEKEEKDEQDFCSTRGVYIVYRGPQIYTYQNVTGDSRVVVSICVRRHTCCTQCGDSSVKLRGGVCRACDVPR